MNKINAQKMYTFYEIINDFNRIRILVCLNSEEMTVDKISKITNLNVTTISSQLAYLRNYENEITYKICDKYMLKIIDSIIKFISVSN